MRLWHKDLISRLPRKQLIGQHRECCALRGKGWGKKHSVVNYVFVHEYGMLFNYHQLVMNEMLNRGYYVSEEWFNPCYRGKLIGVDNTSFTKLCAKNYSEHNPEYLKECLDNLKSKGIYLSQS